MHLSHARSQRRFNRLVKSSPTELGKRLYTYLFNERIGILSDRKQVHSKVLTYLDAALFNGKCHELILQQGVDRFSEDPTSIKNDPACYSKAQIRRVNH